jgi:xylulokinase
VVLGVDSSTQSTKVVAREVRSGRVRFLGRAPHPPTTPPRSEQDPEAWWAALSGLLARVRAEVDAPVAALAVGAQQHGMVVLDAADRVLRPAKLWNDTESAEDAARLVAELGPETWATRTGSVPTAAFTVTKVAWLARCEPEVHARVRHLLLPHDWLTWRLTGARVTDRGDASGTGYFDPTGGQWLPELLERVGLDPEVVPSVLRPTEAAGTWQGAVVGPGTGDNMAAALGLGLQAGDVAISVGTSGTVFVRADRPTADPTGAVAGFADARGGFLPLVCTLNAAKVFDRVAALLGVDLDTFGRLALEAPPGAGGLTLLPFLDGERTPNLPHASGVLRGIRSDLTREALARAAVEGVACLLLEALDRLAEQGVPVGGRLLLVGGGARSAALQRVLAGLARRPVRVPEDEELVATGAALQAAAVLEAADPDELGAAWHLGDGHEVPPEPGATGAADEVRERFRAVLLESFPEVAAARPPRGVPGAYPRRVGAAQDEDSGAAPVGR